MIIKGVLRDHFTLSLRTSLHYLVKSKALQVNHYNLVHFLLEMGNFVCMFGRGYRLHFNGLAKTGWVECTTSVMLFIHKRLNSSRLFAIFY